MIPPTVRKVDLVVAVHRHPYVKPVQNQGVVGSRRYDPKQVPSRVKEEIEKPGRCRRDRRKPLNLESYHRSTWTSPKPTDTLRYTKGRELVTETRERSVEGDNRNFGCLQLLKRVSIPTFYHIVLTPQHPQKENGNGV